MEAKRETVPHYEATAGIRPAHGRGGRVRGVAYEYVPGGGVELHSCDHDHAPGVRDCRKLTPKQRDAAADCAAEWLAGQISAGELNDLPVTRIVI